MSKRLPDSADANYQFTDGRDIWSGPAPVGSFAPNGYGVYDVAGNVYEWCEDWYDEYYYKRSPKRNPTGPDSGIERVLRGGSWISEIERVWRDGSWYDYGPYDLRVADRYNAKPSSSVIAIGFRCGMSRSD